MRELSVAEQRYQAVLAVISDGLSISQVAEKVGVSRQTLHAWLARYEKVRHQRLRPPMRRQNRVHAVSEVSAVCVWRRDRYQRGISMFW